MVNTKVVQLTKAQFESMEAELNFLKKDATKKNTDAIKEARKDGDLSENAEYDAAKNEQAEIQGKIHILEAKLTNAIIIEPNSQFDEIEIGHKITLEDIDTKKSFTFMLLGEWNGLPESHEEILTIPYNSLLGQNILGKKLGESITYESRNGQKNYTVMKIQ